MVWADTHRFNWSKVFISSKITKFKIVWKKIRLYHDRFIFSSMKYSFYFSSIKYNITIKTPCIFITDSEGVVKRKLRPDSGVLKCPLYVTVDPRFAHVYVSDYESGIIGMDMSGNIIFK